MAGNGANGNGTTSGRGAAATAKRWNEPRSAQPWRRTIDRATYLRILEGFREFPGNAAGAARLAGVDRRTAKRAWLYGWAASDFAPLKTVIEAEQAEERARIASARARAIADEALDEDTAFPSLTRARSFLRDAEAAAAGAAGDDELKRARVEARLVETRIAALARQNAVGLLAANGDLLRGALKLAAKVRRTLENDDRIPADKGIRLLASLASSTRHAVEAAQRSFELERQLQASDGGEQPETMSVEEALRVLSDAAPTLDRLRAPTLTVIQGGEADRADADDPDLDAELDAEVAEEDPAPPDTAASVTEPATTTATTEPTLTISGDPVVFANDDDDDDEPDDGGAAPV